VPRRRWPLAKRHLVARALPRGAGRQARHKNREVASNSSAAKRQAARQWWPSPPDPRPYGRQRSSAAAPQYSPSAMPGSARAPPAVHSASGTGRRQRPRRSAEPRVAPVNRATRMKTTISSYRCVPVVFVSRLQGAAIDAVRTSRSSHAARVRSGRIWLPAAGTFARTSTGTEGPAATSGPVTPRRVGGEHVATSVDSCTLSDGEEQGEPAHSRLWSATPPWE